MKRSRRRERETETTVAPFGATDHGYTLSPRPDSCILRRWLAVSGITHSGVSRRRHRRLPDGSRLGSSAPSSRSFRASRA